MNEFRVVEVDGGFEPQMRASCGRTGELFWTPLLATGYWAEPTSFNNAEVLSHYPLPTRLDAATAIKRARAINQDKPLLTEASQSGKG